MDILSKGDEHKKAEKTVPAYGVKTAGSTGIAQTKVEYTALQISEMKYRRLFETAQDGILILDGDTGQVTDVNPFLTDLLGYSKKELEGKTLWEIGIFEDISASKKAYEELQRNGYIRYSDLPLKTKGKRQVEVEFVSNIYNVNGSRIIQCNIRDNTVHKKLEDALRISEDQYQTLVEVAHEGIAVSQEGMFKFANHRVEEITGYSKQELHSIKFIDTIYADDRAMVMERSRQRLKGGNPPGIYGLRIVTKSGGIRWLEINTILTDWQGKPAILSFMNDITERQQAEEILIRSEQNFRNSIDNSPLGVLIVSDIPEFSFLYSNQAVLDIYGYSSLQEFQTIRPEQRFTPQGYIEYMERREKRLRGEPISDSLETSIVRKDGTVRYLQVLTKEVTWEGKKQIQLIHIDITERKMMEEQIIKSKALLQTVIDSSPDRIAVKDSQHRYLLVNKGLANLLNVRPQKMIGKFDTDFFSQERILGNDAKGIRSIHGDDALALAGQTVRNISKTIDEKGNPEIFDAYRVPLTDQEGNTYGVLSYSRDITELYCATENLKKSYEKVQKSLDETVAAIGTICEIRDPYTAGHQTRVSQLACALAAEIGLTEDTISNIKIGGTLHDIGKIYVPAEILSKPGKLSEMEFAIIKNHPQVGYDIIKGIDFPNAVSQIVLQHHERLDGSGYPHGLTAEDITIEAKIIAVADVVEAMSSYRPYRPALGVDKALEEISMNKGKLYDPVVSNACLNLFNEKSFKFAE